MEAKAPPTTMGMRGLASLTVRARFFMAGYAVTERNESAMTSGHSSRAASAMSWARMCGWQVSNIRTR